jgi:hypothetical protein
MVQPHNVEDCAEGHTFRLDMVGSSFLWLLPFLLAGEHHSCVAAFLPMPRLEHGTRASQHKSVQQFHLPSTALPFTRSASTKLNAVSDLLIAVDIPELAKLFVACSVTASLALGAVAVTSLIFKIALFVAKDVVKTWQGWTSYLTKETAEIPPISLNAVRETSFSTVTLITPKKEDVNSTVDASGSLSVVTKSVHLEASILGIAYYEGTLGSSEMLDAEAKPDVRTEMPWNRRNLRAMKFPPAEATTSTSGTSVLRVTLAFEENPADISSVAFALDRLVPIKPIPVSDHWHAGLLSNCSDASLPENTNTTMAQCPTRTATTIQHPCDSSSSGH